MQALGGAGSRKKQAAARPERSDRVTNRNRKHQLQIIKIPSSGPGEGEKMNKERTKNERFTKTNDHARKEKHNKHKRPYFI